MPSTLLAMEKRSKELEQVFSRFGGVENLQALLSEYSEIQAAPMKEQPLRGSNLKLCCARPSEQQKRLQLMDKVFKPFGGASELDSAVKEYHVLAASTVVHMKQAIAEKERILAGSNYGTTPEGGACQAHQDCEGFKSLGPGLACCPPMESKCVLGGCLKKVPNKTCQQKDKDYTGTWWCPNACKSGLFAPNGSCKSSSDSASTTQAPTK